MERVVSKRRRQNTPVLEGLLLDEFHRFDFFQAVRLLELLHPDAEGIGEGSTPAQEAVSFSARVGLEFPASNIFSLSPGRVSSVFSLREETLREIADREHLSAQAMRNLAQIVEHRFSRREFRNVLHRLIGSEDPAMIRRLMIQAARSEPHRMQVTFLGLAGAFGPLPTPYTEMIMERQKSRDPAPAEFLDLFNHRLISLRYRVHKNFRVGFSTTSPEKEPLSRKLLSLTGATREFQQEQLTGHERSMLDFVGLLSQRPRSTWGLKTVLSGLFELPVEVRDWKGAWADIEPSQRTRIGNGSGAMNNLLGAVPPPDMPVYETPPAQAVLGSRLWDQQDSIRIYLGPMPYDRFVQLLPTGSNYHSLCEMVRGYTGHEVGFDFRLRLRPDHIRPTCLTNIWNYETRFASSELLRRTLSGPESSAEWDEIQQGWRFLPAEKIDALMELDMVPFDHPVELDESIEYKIGRVPARKFRDAIFQFSYEMKVRTHAYRLTPLVIKQLAAVVPDERLIPQLWNVATTLPGEGHRKVEDFVKALEAGVDHEVLRPFLDRIIQGALRLQHKPYYTRTELIEALQFAIGGARGQHDAGRIIREDLQEGILGGPRLGWNTWLRTGESITTYTLTRSSIRRLRDSIPITEQVVLLEPLIGRVFHGRDQFLEKTRLMLGHDDWNDYLVYFARRGVGDRPEIYQITPRVLGRLSRFMPEYFIKSLRQLEGKKFEGERAFIEAADGLFRAEIAGPRNTWDLLGRLSGLRGRRLRQRVNHETGRFVKGIRWLALAMSPASRRGSHRDRRLRRMVYSNKKGRGIQLRLKRYHDQMAGNCRRTTLFEYPMGFRLGRQDMARLRSRIPTELVDRIEQGRATRSAEGRGLLFRYFRNEDAYISALAQEIGGYQVLLYRDELLEEGRRGLHSIGRFGYSRQALDRLRADLPRADYLKLEGPIQDLKYLEYQDEGELLEELADRVPEALVQRHLIPVVKHSLRNPNYPTIRLARDFNGPPALRAADETGLMSRGGRRHG